MTRLLCQCSLLDSPLVLQNQRILYLSSSSFLRDVFHPQEVIPIEMAATNIQSLPELLTWAATTHGANGLIIYPPGTAGSATTTLNLSYQELLERAKKNAHLLRDVLGSKPNTIILLHFKSHFENFLWFWSALFAGYVPAMSTPFTINAEQRLKHLFHLDLLLDSPPCLTNRVLISEFSGQSVLRVIAVESLVAAKCLNYQDSSCPIPEKDDLAALMLTSGSTGNAKAVCLTHKQILASVAGKSLFHNTSSTNPFLNWIGSDHVACLTEIHIHALFLGADQVHIQADDVLSDPLVFLDLLSKHRVAYTFAPNFFLANLRRAIDEANEEFLVSRNTVSLDLSYLQTITSGGEANVTETCEAITSLLKSFGASHDMIRPGFGMTETCAGSIYSKECPSLDVANQRQFAALGSCVPGIELRITTDGALANPGEHGELEVHGPIVFSEYYNNQSATSNAFTCDGWFKTGDRAFVDKSGHLNLIGRSAEKSVLNVNGVKHNPKDLEIAIEDARIKGVTPSYTIALSYREDSFQTEGIYIIYLPDYSTEDVATRISANDAICAATMSQTGVRPRVLPLDASMLQKSTLGKMSRIKIQEALIRGDYQTFQAVNERLIKSYREAHLEEPSTEMECMIFQECVSMFNVEKHTLGVSTSIFEVGATSINLIRLKKRLQVFFRINDIPIVTMLANPTVKSLARALEELQKPHKYSPVVVLQSQGVKTPLWLVHPGVGEVLVFLHLARYITDRPVYALRARGFDGEEFFANIEDAVREYHTAIKTTQPDGPYAIAGYSYGTMLAFEVAKKLSSHYDQVAFLGSFNLPPHIKYRMRQLDWIECLLNLSYFLDFFGSEYAHAISPEMHRLPARDDVLEYIIEAAAPNRMNELGLDRGKLARWADLAFGLQSMARDYEPSGSVKSIDVFYAIPLKAVARTKEEWLAEHLNKWQYFCETEVRFHEVGGTHYTMIGQSHVLAFQKQLKAALQARRL